MKNKFLMILLLSIVINGSSLNAQVSPRVSIQGTLKDANGAAAKDSTYSITFKLYHQAEGGTALWSETAPVEVSEGIYSHYLGSVVPLNTSNFNSTLFLGVVVGNIELSPRTELSYAPYAFAVFDSQCSGAVGDIKHSMLNPAQFALENGACWIPMDGRSIVGSSLANLMNITHVPNAGGLFLRAQEFPGAADRDPDRTSGSPIAVFQDQSMQAHSHALNDPGHGHSFNDRYRNHSGANHSAFSGVKLGSNNLVSEQNVTSLAFTGITINSAGGSETRPVNMNAWVYIRIN